MIFRKSLSNSEPTGTDLPDASHMHDTEYPQLEHEIILFAHLTLFNTIQFSSLTKRYIKIIAQNIRSISRNANW